MDRISAPIDVPYAPIAFAAANFWVLLLAAFLIWDLVSLLEHTRSAWSYVPFTIPSSQERLYYNTNVTIICPTINTEDSFVDCLRSWLRNKPLEIIVVTTDQFEARVRSLVAIGVEIFPDAPVQIMTIDHPNKRDQLIKGIHASKGDILALVDDDAFWKDTVLLSLLAPFQNDDIGLVGGPLTAYLPSPTGPFLSYWEAAAVRLFTKRNEMMKNVFSSDGDIYFIVSGATMILRAEILRDAAFQYAFQNEMWMGQKLNTGDDSFINRWVLFHHLRGNGNKRHWKVGVQYTPEAQVSTTLLPDSRFIGQLKRWSRTGLRVRLKCLLYEPGYWGLRKTCGHMARKMLEAIIAPLLVMIRVVAWCMCLSACLPLALAVVAFEFVVYTKDLVGFVVEFPGCARHLWIILLVDRLHWISSWYGLWSLKTEGWMSRAA